MRYGSQSSGSAAGGAAGAPYEHVVAFGMAARYIGDVVSGTRGIRHNVLITLSVRFPDPEALRTKLAARH